METTGNFEQMNALIPGQILQRSVGPTSFVMGNTYGMRSGFRETNNVIASKNLGYDEVDLPYLLARPHQIKNAVWDSTQAVATELMKIDSATMMQVSTLNSFLNYQYLYRLQPTLELVVAASPTSVGSLIVYYVPYDIKYTEFDINDCTMFAHEFVQPYKQVSAVVQGNYQRASRYNVAKEWRIGTFYVAVFNKLGGGSTAESATKLTVTAFVNFEKISMRVPVANAGASILNFLTQEEKRLMAHRLRLAFQDSSDVDEVVTKGLEDSIVDTTANTLPQPPIDIVEEKLTEQIAPDEPVGGASTEYVGFLKVQHDNLKLSLQRFGLLFTTPAPGYTWTLEETEFVVLYITMDDLVKCILGTHLFFCWSGGLRIKWVTNAIVTDRGFIKVESIGCEQYFNIQSYPEHTLTLPYWSDFSAKYVWPQDNSYDTPNGKVGKQFLKISIQGAVTKKFMMRFFLATADDFVLQGIIPTLKYKNQVWSQIPEVYLGVKAKVPPLHDDDVVTKAGNKTYKKQSEVSQTMSTGKSFLDTVSSVVGGIIDTVEAVTGLGWLIGLFDRPDRYHFNEFNITDTPQDTTRLQYSNFDYVPYDQTVSCDSRGIEMMQMSRMLEIPLRVEIVKWSTETVVGTSLGTWTVGPQQHGLYEALEEILPYAYRGTMKLKFEVVKNVFHKGVIVAILNPTNVSVTLSNFNDHLNKIFDISGGDSFEFDIEFVHTVDYHRTNEGAVKVELLVLNQLVSHNTVNQIDVNVYVSFSKVQFRLPKPPSVFISDLAVSAGKAGPWTATPPPALKKKRRQVKMSVPTVETSESEFEVLPIPVTKGLESTGTRAVENADIEYCVLKYNRDGKKRRSFAPHDFLCSCETRIRISMERDIGFVVSAKDLPQNSTTLLTHSGTNAYHYHDEERCVKGFSPLDPMELQRKIVSFLYMNGYTIPTVNPVLKRRTGWIDMRGRFFRIGSQRYLVYNDGEHLVKMNITSLDPYDAYYTLTQMDFSVVSKGALATKMGSGLGTGLAKGLMKTKLPAAIDDIVDTVRSKVEEVDEECMKKMIQIATLKIPAYLFEAASIVDWRGIVAIILHLLGDALAVAAAYEALTKLITDLMGNVHEIVSSLTSVYSMSDDGLDSRLKTIWKLIKPAIRGVCGKTYSGFDTFVKFLKPIAALGQAVKGLTFVVDFFKSILEWFGFCLTEKKKHAIETQKWLKIHGKELDSDLARMAHYNVFGNPHALVSEDKQFKEIKMLAMRGYMYKERLYSIWNTASCRGNVEIINCFLKKCSELPDDPLETSGFEPVFIMLQGKPGRGKSLAASRLAKLFASILGGDEKLYYRVNLDSEYWTGCADQKVLIIDDIFQDPQGTGVAKLTQLISPVGCPVPKADISGKFGISQAMVVIGTTNSMEPTTGSMTCPTALIRRFKDTHFQAQDNSEWKQIFHDSANLDASVTFSEEMTVEDVSRVCQNVLRTKLTRHEKLLRVQPLRADPLLAQSTEKIRMQSKIDHAQQVSMKKEDLTAWLNESVDIEQTVVYSTESLNPFDDEEGEVVTKGSENVFVPGSEFDTMQGFYEELILTDLQDVEDFLAKNVKYTHQKLTGKKELIEVKYKHLDVPFRYEEKANVVFYEHLASCFRGLKFSPDVSDPRNRFVFAVSSDLRADPRKVLRDIVDASEQTLGSRMRMWLQAATDVIVEATVIATCVVSVGVMAGTIGLFYLSASSADTVGAYDTRPHVVRQSRQMGVVQKVVSKGLSETRPFIDKSILGWRVTRPNGRNINLHCLSVGSGYVLVNNHGLIMGMQHYITYTEGDFKREVPVHVSENTVIEFTCGEETTLDLCLVYIGSTIPLRKDILNYFVSENQLKILIELDAIALLPRGKTIVPEKVRLSWKQRQHVANRTTGEAMIQSCYAGAITLNDGDCGSPCVVNGGPLDGKILGIASAGSVARGVFLPICKEVILEAMGALSEVVMDSRALIVENVAPVRAQDPLPIEFVNNAWFAPVALGCDSTYPTPKVPEVNPQFMPLCGSSVDEETRVSLASKLQKTNIDSLDLRVNHGYPSIKKMINSPAKLELPGGREADGQIFSNSVPVGDFDSPKLEMALQTVRIIYDGFVSPCRVLEEAEILNRVEIMDEANDIVIQSNGVNPSSASGHLMDQTFGKYKRGHWIQTEADGFKTYGPELEKLVNELDMKLRSGICPKHLIEMHYKDELRNSEKILCGKCRIFFVGDFAVWCLQKKYFGDFMAKFKGGCGFRGKHSLGCDVVKYWNGWGQILSKYKVLSGDVSGWDTSVTGWHMELVRRLIEYFYPNSSSEDRMARKLLIDSGVWSICAMADRVFMASGLKSGTFATTELNSITHTIIIVYCLLSILSTEEIIEHPFLTNGDDALIAVFDDTQKTVEMFEHGYKELGFKLTGTDKTKGIEVTDVVKATYLKRSFIPIQSVDGVVYMPRIDRVTIANLMHYKRKGTPVEENVRNAVTFARQGFDPLMFGWVQTVAFMTYKIPFVAWEEVSTWYEQNPVEAKITEVPIWNPCQHFSDATDWEAELVCRKASLKVLPFTQLEAVQLLARKRCFTALALCDESGVEFPVFTYMKKQLRNKYIYGEMDCDVLCCVWWFFCYYEERADVDAVLLMKDTMVTQDMLKICLSKLSELPWGVQIGHMTVAQAIKKNLEIWPIWPDIVVMALFHVLVHFCPDASETVSFGDLVAWFDDAGVDIGVHLTWAGCRSAENEYWNRPTRIPGHIPSLLYGEEYRAQILDWNGYGLESGDVHPVFVSGTPDRIRYKTVCTGSDWDYPEVIVITEPSVC